MLIKENNSVLRKAVTGAKDVGERPLSKEAKLDGRVLMVDRKRGQVLVEGIDFIYRHVQPARNTRRADASPKRPPWISPA